MELLQIPTIPDMIAQLQRSDSAQWFAIGLLAVAVVILWWRGRRSILSSHKY